MRALCSALLALLAASPALPASSSFSPRTPPAQLLAPALRAALALPGAAPDLTPAAPLASLDAGAPLTPQPSLEIQPQLQALVERLEALEPVSAGAQEAPAPAQPLKERPQADPRRLLKAAGEALRDVPLERIASMPAEEAHGLAAKIFEGAAAPQPEDPPLAPALARFEAEFRAPARLAGVAEAKLPAVLSPAGRRTPLVFVLVHGLGESPAGMERLARLLAEQGHNVVSTLLSGHGSTSEALEGVPLARWDQDVDRAAAFARELGERVVLVGFSLGGNLAFRAARRMGSDAAGLLLLSPGLSFGPPLDRKLKGRAAAGARWTTDQPLADEYSNPRVPMSTYPEVSAAMAAAREAVAAAAGSAAPLLSVPSLTVASASDGYIDHDLLRAFAAAAGSELLVYSDRSMRHNEPIRPPGSWPEAFLAALRRFLDKITP